MCQSCFNTNKQNPSIPILSMLLPFSPLPFLLIAISELNIDQHSIQGCWKSPVFPQNTLFLSSSIQFPLSSLSELCTFRSIPILYLHLVCLDAPQSCSEFIRSSAKSQGHRLKTNQSLNCFLVLAQLSSLSLSLQVPSGLSSITASCHSPDLCQRTSL